MWDQGKCCYLPKQLLLIFLDANLSLGSSSGIVIAVPISKEESANGLDIEKATQTALKEAR